MSLTDEEKIRQLAQVICICKGINLGRVLKALDGCETVADVNAKAGTGTGGCAGERCGVVGGCGGGARAGEQALREDHAGGV